MLNITEHREPTGRFRASCTLNIQPLTTDQPVTDEQMKTFLSKPNIERLVPRGGTFLEGEGTAIDQRPAAWIRHYTKGTSARMQMHSVTDLYAVYADRSFVMLGCSVGAPNERASRNELMDAIERYAPLYRLIANSIVVR